MPKNLWLQFVNMRICCFSLTLRELTLNVFWFWTVFIHKFGLWKARTSKFYFHINNSTKLLFASLQKYLGKWLIIRASDWLYILLIYSSHQCFPQLENLLGGCGCCCVTDVHAESCAVELWGACNPIYFLRLKFTPSRWYNLPTSPKRLNHHWAAGCFIVTLKSGNFFLST